MASKYTPLLQRVEIFDNVSDADLDRIAEIVKERRFHEGQIIFKQGDDGNTLMIVVDGRIKVFTNEGGVEKTLAFYSEGQVLGEMALLTGEPRSAAAQAMGETRVLELNKNDFDTYLANNVAVMREMMRIIAIRQQQTNLRLSRDAAGGDGDELTPRGRQGKVLVVFSPRGGAGKTTVAVNLAVSLAQAHPDQVALLDLSLTFGHCALVLNLVPKASLATASAETISHLDREGMSYYTVTHESTVRVISGSLKPEEGEAVTGDHVKNALDLLKRLNNYIVVDVSSNFSEATIAALEAADKIVLLATPELATLRDVREVQRIFTDLIKVPKEKVMFVMNQNLPFKPLGTDQFSSALEQEMHDEIPFGQDLPAKSATKGDAFTQTQPGANISKAIDRLARVLDQELSPSTASRQQERRGLFGRR
jgi:Flp pilus assembly CpaE family ATPase